MDAPEGKKNQTREDGKVTVIPHIGGLHHHYESKQHDPKDKGGSVFGTHRRAGQPSMDEIAWHRRETRRQTEKTNLVLELGSPPPTRQAQAPPFWPHEKIGKKRTLGSGLARYPEQECFLVPGRNDYGPVLYKIFVKACRVLNPGSSYRQLNRSNHSGSIVKYIGPRLCAPESHCGGTF